jgi:bifunctional UDP-N-acetylglucosamine pyrophosphorylase/glucosamine-1-phosphate N-acetyltransferase
MDFSSSSPADACVAVVLAAGHGTRFKGARPKLVQELGGLPIVAHVVRAARSVGPAQVVVVVGPHSAAVREALAGSGVRFALQAEPAGTADALRAARPALPGRTAELLVLSGDVPLVRTETLVRLLEHHRSSSAAATLLTAELEDPTGYGRIVRDAAGAVTAIVEQRDADRAARRIREINAGLYVMRAPLVFEVIEGIDRANAQGEYYLTDVVAHLVARGERVEALSCARATEILGVNRLEELDLLKRLVRRHGQQQGGGTDGDRP